MGGICGCLTLGVRMSSASFSLPLVREGDGAHICGIAGVLGSAYTG